MTTNESRLCSGPDCLLAPVSPNLDPPPAEADGCVLTEAGGLGAEDWGRHGESLSEESPTRPGAVWRGINESNTTL